MCVCVGGGGGGNGLKTHIIQCAGVHTFPVIELDRKRNSRSFEPWLALMHNTITFFFFLALLPKRYSWSESRNQRTYDNRDVLMSRVICTSAWTRAGLPRKVNAIQEQQKNPWESIQRQLRRALD